MNKNKNRNNVKIVENIYIIINVVKVFYIKYIWYFKKNCKLVISNVYY